MNIDSCPFSCYNCAERFTCDKYFMLESETQDIHRFVMQDSSGIPYKCPVCNGTGLVSTPPGVPGDVPTYSYGSVGPFSCRSCNGTGIIWSCVEKSPVEDVIPPRKVFLRD